MAEITSIQLRTTEVPLVEGGCLFSMKHSFPVDATLAEDADTVTVFELPADVRIVGALFHIAGTLGTSCVATLRHNDGVTPVVLTAASTAAQDNTLRGVNKGIDASAGDKIDILIGGADIAAATSMEVDVICMRR